MSRIIAGTAGGQRLAAVPGDQTRPTTDRVKESLFAKLDAWGMLHEAAVLDLFAGSGALGCEAASRGAARAVLVERQEKVVAVARRNAAVVNTALGRQAVTVHRGSVAAWLATPAAAGPWDLVLMDPPYPLGEAELAQVLAATAPRLLSSSVVVVERSARSPEPDWPETLRLLEHRTHGETALWFAELAGD